MRLSGWAAVMGVLIAFAAVALVLIIVPVTVDRLMHGESVGELYGQLARLAFVVLVPGIVLGVGVMMAASVAAERQRQTLESLLSLPIERRDLLRAKVRSGVRAAWPVVWVLAVRGGRLWARSPRLGLSDVAIGGSDVRARERLQLG